MNKLLKTAALLALSGPTALAQGNLPYIPDIEPVVAVPNHSLDASAGVAPGLTLFQPMSSATTYLVDELGTVVNTWLGSGTPGLSVYMLDNGNLLRTTAIGSGPGGGGGGRVQEVTWNNTVLWGFDYSSSSLQGHHDVEYLPNGNVLMIAWEYLSSAEAQANGRDPALLSGGTFSPDHIIEIQPDGLGGGSIVWEWHVWDHLIQDFDNTKANFGVVGDHPELIDVNFPVVATNDWNHCNGMDYNAEFDQIVISSQQNSEVWVIDHSTTTAEAAGHTGGDSGKGGDLLYRWGNPQAYDAGLPGDKQLFGQHDIQWIAEGRPGAGNFIVFNNGLNRPAGPFSSVDEFAPPVDALGNYALTPGSAYGPAAALWSYTDPVPTSLYSSIICGTERLENGNTLITLGTAGLMFEVTPAKAVVWSYTNPFAPGGSNWVFRSRRYDLCAGVVYCTAGTSANGCLATLSGTGQASATAASGFVVSAAGVEGNKNGQFYFGVNGRQALAWGTGSSFRCVAPPTTRAGLLTPSGTLGGCDGSFAQDLNALWTGAPAKNPGAGAQVQVQLWYRDPLNTSNQSTSFSDALEFVVCP